MIFQDFVNPGSTSAGRTKDEKKRRQLRGNGLGERARSGVYRFRETLLRPCALSGQVDEITKW